MLRDILLFLKGIGSNWVSIVTGGAALMFLALWERFSQVQVRPLLYWLVIGGALLVATFKTWQDEKGRAEKAEAELAQMRSTDAGLVKRKMTDAQFWLLSLVQEHGARRQMFTSEGGTGSTLFLGGSPISSTKTRWLYDLVDEAVRSGLLALTEGRVINTYSIPAEIQASIAAYRRSSRRIEIPKDMLYDAVTGQPVAFNI